MGKVLDVFNTAWFKYQNKTNKTKYFQGELFWVVGGDQSDFFFWKNDQILKNKKLALNRNVL